MNQNQLTIPESQSPPLSQLFETIDDDVMHNQKIVELKQYLPLLIRLHTIASGFCFLNNIRNQTLNLFYFNFKKKIKITQWTLKI